MRGVDFELVCNNSTGRCLCKPEFTGPTCDECSPGYYKRGEECVACECDQSGSVSASCDVKSGQPQCRCFPNRTGPKCDRCNFGYFKYPECIGCSCNPIGSVTNNCDQRTGDCVCKANFTGKKCDECKENTFCGCNAYGTDEKRLNDLLRSNSKTLVCPCKPNVIGLNCDTCQKGHYSLHSGCLPCDCNINGTLNELTDLCHPVTGQCECKAFVDSAKSCDQCAFGYHSMQRENAFGCVACDCHPGSSRGHDCDRVTGECDCLPNIEGKRCDQIKLGFFVPDLHQLKFELEDGYDEDDQPINFDFDDSFFPGYSWRGYVHLNKFIRRVSVEADVNKTGSYKVILRYLNTNLDVAQVGLAIMENQQSEAATTTIYLYPNIEPAFETSQLSVDLESGKQYMFVFENKNENVFVDYFVLLPLEYHEASLLKKSILEPCSQFHSAEPCVLNRYPSIEKYFPSEFASQKTNDADLVNLHAIKNFDPDLYSPLLTGVSAEWPRVHNIKVPFVDGGKVNYLILDYLNPGDEAQEVQVEVYETKTNAIKTTGRVSLSQCNITTLCRVVILDKNENEPLKVNRKPNEADAFVRIKAESSLPGQSVLYQMAFVPQNEFDPNLIKMAPYALAQNGQVKNIELNPLPSKDQIKLDLWSAISRPVQDKPDHIPAQTTYFSKTNKEKHFQLPRVLGKSQDYQMFIVHYYQPKHTFVDMEVTLETFPPIVGTFRANYCPSKSGCRAIVKFQDGIDSSQTFSSAPFYSVKFKYVDSGNKDIWLENAYIINSGSVTSVSDIVPNDYSSKFLDECIQNKFRNYEIEPSTFLFCDQAVLSLSASYNDGAQSCGCNLLGSYNPEYCEPFGGQCSCKENIIGRKCEQCRLGYYGFPYCIRCDCPSGNCNQTTGECLNPPNTDSEGKCLDGYHSFHPINGCKKCRCDSDGVQSGTQNTCDPLSGQCYCKPNVDGVKCEKCKAGFYKYPICAKCNCNENGTLPEICNASTSVCACKANVMGARCDQCKPNTFSLEGRNPLGCTKCFCFGHTTYCNVSSNLYFKDERNMNSNEWSLAHAKPSSQVSNLRIGDQDGVLFVEVVEDPDQNEFKSVTYWSAPDSYLGNKVTSYGGRIQYTIKVLASGDHDQTEVINRAKPDLILVGNYGEMILAHSSSSVPSSDKEPFTYSIDLVESEFYHLDSGLKVKREQLMIVLSQLTEIKLRAIYFKDIHESELVDFQMDVVSENESGSRKASSVEKCECPRFYTGPSCESCDEGYYKVRGSGSGQFTCQPCKCNGYTQKCDQETGKCIDCGGNTQGDHCDECQPKYYKSSSAYGPGYECKICPCPFPEVFAESCYEDKKTGMPKCQNCFEGHEGDYCDRCKPGYFTPNNSRCLPCECNSNIDLNDRDACDSRTGQCKKCLFNTTGSNCEKCLEWYFGDPIGAKNCQETDCNRDGSESYDSSTGQCICKTNVIGEKCDQCAVNTFGLKSGKGCSDCQCDPVGSESESCDEITGACVCKPGVGGTRCNECLPDHWNFGPNGCLKCECDINGTESLGDGFRCNQNTGDCYCIPGVRGPRCDQCEDRWILVKQVGCKACDSCIHTLLNETEELTPKLTELQEGFNNMDTYLERLSQNLNVLQVEDKLLNEHVVGSGWPAISNSSVFFTTLNMLESAREEITKYKEITAKSISDKARFLTSNLLPSVLPFHRDTKILKLDVERLGLLIEYILDRLENKDESSIYWQNTMTENQLKSYQSLVNEMKIPFSQLSSEYENSFSLFSKLNATVHSREEQVRNAETELAKIEDIKEYKEKSMVEFENLILRAKQELDKKTLDSNKDIVLLDHISYLTEYAEYAQNIMKDISSSVDRIEQVDIEALNGVAGESSVEIGIQGCNDTIKELRAALDRSNIVVKGLDANYELKEKDCVASEEKAVKLSETAQKWTAKVEKAKEKMAGLKVIEAMKEVVLNMEISSNKTADINKTLENLAFQDLVFQIDHEKDRSNNQSKLIDSQIKQNEQLGLNWKEINMSYANLEKKFGRINSSLSGMYNWSNATAEANTIYDQMKIEIESQASLKSSVKEKANSLIVKMKALNTLTSSVGKNEDMVSNLESSITSLTKSIPKSSLVKLGLTNESDKAEDFASDMKKLEVEFNELKSLLKTTRRIANNLRASAYFNGTDSYISVKPIDDSSSFIYPSMVTTTSIYLNTQEANVPIAFVYNKNTPGEYLALYLKSGKPHLQYRLSDLRGSKPTVVTIETAVNDGLWHKLEISRVGRLVEFKVYSENGEVSQEKKLTSADEPVVFNIDSESARFMLGKFPDKAPFDVRSALYGGSNSYTGLIDSFSFNGQDMGLWNYRNISNVQAGPVRSWNSQNQVVAERGAFFEGQESDSHMCRENRELFFRGGRSKVEVKLKFKTVSEDGLLWVWYKQEINQDHVTVLSLYLDSGRLSASLSPSLDTKFFLLQADELEAKKKFNDNKYHTIKLSLSRVKTSSTEYQLNMTVTEIAESGEEIEYGHKSESTGKYFALVNGTVCVGGIASIGKGPKGPSLKSIKGSMISMSLNGPAYSQDINLYDELLYNKHQFVFKGVEPDSGTNKDVNQCKVNHSMDDTHIRFDLNDTQSEEEETIGISFKTQDPHGLLFFRLDKYPNDKHVSMLLQLEYTRVFLAYLNASYELAPNVSINFNDNKLHSLFVTRRKSSIKLRIDGSNSYEMPVAGDLNVEQRYGKLVSSHLFVAGVDRDYAKDLTKVEPYDDIFNGCIVEIIHNNRLLDLRQASHYSGSVEFTKCF